MKNAILFLVLFCYSINAQFSGSKIVVTDETFDFGEVEEGIIVSHKFTIINRGSENLEIQKVKASCGCTAAEPLKNILAPFDSTTIEVKFNTKNRTGKQKKYVYVFSNDKETPQLRLSFTADIVKGKIKTSQLNSPKLKLSKYIHNFGDVKKGERLELIIDYKNEGGEDLLITNTTSSCECISISLNAKQLRPKENGKLILSLDTKALIGKIVRTLTLQSNDTSEPQQVITLTANILQG